MQTSHYRYADHTLQRGQGAVAYIKDQSVVRVTHSKPKYKGLLNYVDQGVTVQGQITDIGTKVRALNNQVSEQIPSILVALTVLTHL